MKKHQPLIAFPSFNLHLRIILLTSSDPKKYTSLQIKILSYDSFLIHGIDFLKKNIGAGINIVDS